MDRSHAKLDSRRDLEFCFDLFDDCFFFRAYKGPLTRAMLIDDLRPGLSGFTIDWLWETFNLSDDLQSNT